MASTHMSRTISILLGLALVWLTAWSLAAYFTYASGSESLRTAAQLSTPSTVLEQGADVRIEGTLVAAPTVKATYSERHCLAAHTTIIALSRYQDSQDNWWTDSAVIKELRVGPGNIVIAADDRRIELPLDRWAARDRTSEAMQELPARLGVTAGEVAAAKARLRGSFTGFSVSEGAIDGGTHVFVVGKLEDRDGSLLLAPDRLLGHVDLFLGTQADYVKEMERKGSSARTVAWVFAPIGPLPLAVLGLVLLVRSRKRRAVIDAPSRA